MGATVATGASTAHDELMALMQGAPAEERSAELSEFEMMVAEEGGFEEGDQSGDGAGASSEMSEDDGGSPDSEESESETETETTETETETESEESEEDGESPDSEEEDEDADDGSESEESDDDDPESLDKPEGAEEDAPPWWKDRMTRLSRQKAEKDARIEELESSLAEASASAEEMEPVIVKASAPASEDDVLWDCDTEDEVRERVASARKVRKWAIDHIEGTTVQRDGAEVEYSASDMARAKANADDVIAGAESRLRLLESRDRTVAAAKKLYPSLYKKGSEESKLRLGLLRDAIRPDFPGADLMIGRAAVGALVEMGHYRLVKVDRDPGSDGGKRKTNGTQVKTNGSAGAGGAGGQGKRKVAAATAAPKKRAGSAAAGAAGGAAGRTTAPKRRPAGAATKGRALKRFAKSGATEDLEAYLEQVL